MNSHIEQLPSSDAEEPAAIKQRSNRFFRKSGAPLARDDARRQGDISQLAYLVMGGRDPAVAFLNADNAELGGRPLAIATASAKRSEEQTSELQSLMRISYAVFCLKKKNTQQINQIHNQNASQHYRRH